MSRLSTADLEAKNSIPFKAPNVEIEIPAKINELMTPKQPDFLYAGDNYNRLIQLLNIKESKISELKNELNIFEDKATTLIIRICLFFCIFLVLTAIWSYFLRR